MKQINLYSNGFSFGNPGAGAWGTILEYQGKEKELSGINPMTTSNQMKLAGVIEGLKSLKEPCRVNFISSSTYVIEGINEYLNSWLKSSWKTADKKAVKNKELWKEYIKASKKHIIKTTWIKEHEANWHNERCDILARTQAQTLK